MHWSTGAPLDLVEQFSVVRKPPSPFDPEGDPGYVFYVELAQGRRKPLIWRYPRGLLLTLAGHLSARSKSLTTFFEDDDLVGPGKRPVREDNEVPTEIGERPEPPRDTRIVLEPKGDHLVFTIPRAPFFSLPSFVLQFLTFGCMGVVLAIFGLRVAVDEWSDGIHWRGRGTPPLFGIGFVLFGLGLATASTWNLIDIIFRKRLTVTPSGLILERKIMGWKKRREWSRAEIERLGVVTTVSWMRQNNPPQYTTSLQIMPRPGRSKRKPIRLLEWRTKAELEWIATTIRRVLKVPGL